MCNGFCLICVGRRRTYHPFRQSMLPLPIRIIISKHENIKMAKVGIIILVITIITALRRHCVSYMCGLSVWMIVWMGEVWERRRERERRKKGELPSRSHICCLITWESCICEPSVKMHRRLLMYVYLASHWFCLCISRDVLCLLCMYVRISDNPFYVISAWMNNIVTHLFQLYPCWHSVRVQIATCPLPNT